jgi:hypothetical protein
MSAPAVFYPGAEIYEHWRIAGTVCPNATEIDCLLIIDVSWAGKNFFSINNFVLTDTSGNLYKFVKENFTQIGQTLYVWGKLTVGGVDKDIWLQAGSGINVINDGTLFSDIGFSITGSNRYSMDESSGTINGIYSDNLTNHNGTLGVDGKIGKAWRGNTTTAWLTGSNSQTLHWERTQALTILSIVKRSVTGINSLIIATKENSSPDFRGHYFSVSSGKLNFYLGGTAAQYLSVTETNVSINDTTDWHTAAATYDGSSSTNGVILYTDGNANALSKAGTLNSSTLNLSTFQVGKYGVLASGASYGSIDELRIYNTVKSQDYIKGWSNLVLSNSTYAQRISYGTAGSTRRRRYYSGFGPGKF